MAILRDKHTFPFRKLAVDRAEGIDLGNTPIHGNCAVKISFGTVEGNVTEFIRC